MNTALTPAAALALLTGVMAAAPAHADGDAIRDALKSREGKSITLVLNSGTELTGKLGEVTKESVRLTELSGKEFFDATVELDAVAAVVYRVRDR